MQAGEIARTLAELQGDVCADDREIAEVTSQLRGFGRRSTSGGSEHQSRRRGRFFRLSGFGRFTRQARQIIAADSAMPGAPCHHVIAMST